MFRVDVESGSGSCSGTNGGCDLGAEETTEVSAVRSALLGYILYGRREPENTWMGSVSDLYLHVQHLYSAILIHTANCCCRDKPIWTDSCISHNISHPPCCKLAQVVALSSPPFNVKLSVWLPFSCNAAPLIAKATTQKWPSVSPSHSTISVLLSCQQTRFGECIAAEGVSSSG